MEATTAEKTLEATTATTDKYSWIPGDRPGFGHATVFDARLQAKPAYFALHDAFAAP